MEKVISFPFRFVNGGVASVSDQPSIWKDRVYIAVTTGFGERLMTPSYGTDIRSALFEPYTTAADIIKKSAATAFANWLPALTLNSTQVEYDSLTGLLTVTINYTLPNLQTESLTFKTGTFSRSGDFIQG